MKKYGKGSVVQISTVFGPFLDVFSGRDPFKRDFTEIYRITFFGDGNLGNTSAMRVTFFLKIFKIECRFQKCREKNEKKSFVCEIIVSELVALNRLYKKENTCHRRSMC